MKLAAQLIATALMSPALSQSVNVDFGVTIGATVGTPSSSYGAAAAQPGQWNLVNPLAPPLQLVGLSGEPTGISVLGGFSAVAQVPTSAIPPGDDAALMNDLNPTNFQAGNVTTWSFEGLRPARYAVYTYALDFDPVMPPSEVSVPGSSDGTQVIGGDWPGFHLLGETFALHQIDLFGGPLQVTSESTSGFLTRAVINGIQIVEMGPAMIGTSYCATAPNSTGAPAELSALGDPIASANDLTLLGENLPALTFGFFLTSPDQLFESNPGGSAGNLCVGPSIGRYVGPGQIQSSGVSGTIALTLDLTQHPTPGGFVTVQAGQTWNFQAWYRDAAAGSGVSNFTNGFEITFG